MDLKLAQVKHEKLPMRQNSRCSCIRNSIREKHRRLCEILIGVCSLGKFPIKSRHEDGNKNPKILEFSIDFSFFIHLTELKSFWEKKINLFSNDHSKTVFCGIHNDSRSRNRKISFFYFWSFTANYFWTWKLLSSQLNSWNMIFHFILLCISILNHEIRRLRLKGN